MLSQLAARLRLTASHSLRSHLQHRISLLIAIVILSRTTSTTNYPQDAHCPCLEQSDRNRWLQVYAFKVQGFKRLEYRGLNETAVKNWNNALGKGARGGGLFGLGKKCEVMPKVGELQGA